MNVAVPVGLGIVELLGDWVGDEKRLGMDVEGHELIRGKEGCGRKFVEWMS